MAHTEGRLILDDGDGMLLGLFSESDLNAVCYFSETPLRGTGLRESEEDYANALRIAACWNATLGLTTEQVEKADVGRLVEALRSAISIIEDIGDVYTSGSQGQHTMRQIRAALAPFEKGEEEKP